MAAKISVIMGIYQCADTLGAAIDSILSQTYTDWNLILCDDGSKDSTYEIAEQYRKQYPEKIILLKNDKNLGLNITLNRCLSYADGEYIARMDGDDLSLPTRFEKEVRALDAHPEIAIISTVMQYFDADGIWGQGRAVEFPEKKDFIYGTPFCHAPCMVRREAYQAVNGYTVDKKHLRVEDYDLWVKMYVAGYRGMNLMELLYQMRDDRNAVSRRKFRYRINEFLVRCEAIKKLHLPLWGYLYAMRPLILAWMPRPLYEFLHKKRLQS